MRMRLKRSVLRTFWHRVRFTPTWSSPASAANLPQSRATTTSAVCPTTLTLRKSSSRCATCSRTRSVRLAARQPFPGPGLAIRIIGDVTPEKVAIVQDADAIWREEIDKLPMAQRPSQYFAALTNMRSVGVMGDERTYDYAIALRAVTTTDFMTAEVTILPTETITTAANRIVNEVKNINRVMFDYTTKPPATIEWE